jgi:protein arginine kinase
MSGSKKWYEVQGAEGDAVLSTRVRLARNLKTYAFPAKLDIEGRRKVAKTVRGALQTIAPELIFTEMESLPRAHALSLAERRLVSPVFARGIPGAALLIDPAEQVSVLLCEEDHIRLQILQPGLALAEAFARADVLDSALGKQLEYAYDERLGYLTQCPTNLGTAMRASVLLHLPALTALGRVARLGEGISKLGLTIRGAFGEGSEAEGALYQLSNQITLGITEQAALENLQAVTLQVAEQERRAAEELLRQPAFADQVWRAWGILQTARRMESKEAVQLLSLARLGAARSVLPASAATLTALMVTTQPATLATFGGVDAGDAAARDIKRAIVIRQALGTGE